MKCFVSSTRGSGRSSCPPCRRTRASSWPGAKRPAFAWFTEPDSVATFASVRLRRRSLPAEASQLLRERGVADHDVERVARFAKGHPLTLVLAAAAMKEQPAIDFEAIAAHRVIEELTRFFLDGIEDER